MSFVIPKHYDLYFEPNLETFKFKGKTEIKINLNEPAQIVKLHAAELEFHEVKISYDGTNFVTVPKYDVDLAKETVDITLPDNSSLEFTLKFIYYGEHNERLKGFYKGTYMKNGEPKHVLVTQFQAEDARRAFPCVDIPGQKATFDISFLVDNEHFTISNMPILSEVESNGKKLVKFARTPIMSTYLLFFAVGDFEYIETTSNGINYRVIAHPPKAKENGRFALDFGVKVVEYCEKYFDIPYPLPKLDQIATPSFAAGAMENWGAILYREDALLYYDGITPKSQENRILEIIAHEIAHQWFGNLVSPITWNYVWLNESFATFFATHVLDHYYPERRTFEFYVQSTNSSRNASSTSGVLAWDGMIETSPIEVSGEGDLSYSAKTVPIIYEKGGAVLRQIKGFLGDESFRDGLRTYFTKYAYTATHSDNLWQSLEESSNMPVGKIMESFVKQKGHPLISVTQEGTKLTFTQRRFTYLSHDSDTIWSVPLTIRIFQNGVEMDTVKFVLDSTQGSIEVGEFDYYKVNTNLTGFYRVQYEPSYYGKLGDLVQTDLLSSIDKMNILDDVYSLLRAKIIDLNTYFNMANYFRDDNSHMCIFALAQNYQDIYALLEDGQLKEKVKVQANEYINSVFSKIGYHPVEGEDFGISIIRPSLLNIATRFGSEEATTFALLEFEKLQKGEEVSADLRSIALLIGAKKTNNWDWFMDQYLNPISEREGQNALMAMCEFTDIELLNRVKELIFEKVPARNRGIAIRMLTRNELVRKDMWHFYIANLDRIEALSNFIMQGILYTTITSGKEQKEDMKIFFKDYIFKKPLVKDAVDVGMEQLNIDIELGRHLNN